LSYTAAARKEIHINHLHAGYRENALPMLFKKVLNVFLLLCLALPAECSFASAEKDGFVEPKKIIFWAWERPEDLSILDSGTAEVASLAATLKVQKKRLKVFTRQQPLKLPAKTRRITVIRIETDRKSMLAPFSGEMAEIIDDVAGAASARHLQIDFDARVSERQFYRELLLAIRKKLPEAVHISITALASWCMHDRWLEGLPVDEVVPMVFRMGPEGPAILRSLEARGSFAEPMCRTSIGISTDEPVKRLTNGKRVYVFSPTGWNRDSVKSLLQEVE